MGTAIKSRERASTWTGVNGHEGEPLTTATLPHQCIVRQVRYGSVRYGSVQYGICHRYKHLDASRQLVFV